MAKRSATSRKNPRRSPCPISCGLELFGDKWTLLVLRDLMWGKKRYGEFLESPEGIPTNILADRLERLVAGGIVRAEPYQTNPVRHEYLATPAGEALFPILKALAGWGLKHLSGTMTREQVLASQR
jgi:DNA-binding HxlR family transcriptional regulator